ncbi:AI-2E family transporter [Pleurocapsales cyanobacterium LEGE 06147]|nr:AI-2E family transporter [Pleurocapsales cyanobacterium LEGE 06147]
MRLGHWIGLLALLLSLVIIWQIRQIALLGFAAVVLATVLNRVVRSLQRFRIPRGSAIAITVILLLALIAGFFALIVPSLVDQLQQFITLIPQAIDRVRGWYEQLINVIPGQVLENAPNLANLTQQLQTWLTQLLGNFFNLVNTSLTAIISFLLFLVITIMLLLNPLPYRRVFVLAFPAFYRRRVEEILDECETALFGWIKGTLFDMLIIAFLSYIGLLILRVPLPLVNALLAGLLEFIPNVGPTLSVIPPVLLALLDAPWKAVAVLILYFLIQQLESLILVPIVMSQAVDLLPVFTILAVLVFTSFFGFLGLFMSIPLLIVSQIWLKEVLVNDVLDRWQDKTKDNREKNLLIVENDNITPNEPK